MMMMTLTMRNSGTTGGSSNRYGVWERGRGWVGRVFFYNFIYIIVFIYYQRNSILLFYFSFFFNQIHLVFIVFFDNLSLYDFSSKFVFFGIVVFMILFLC